MNNTILEKKKRVSDQILYALIQLSSFLSIFILLVIIGYILYRGIPAFDFSYLVNTTSIINDTVGILPNIINTLYIVIVTLLIACPIGIGGAICLNEYTKNKKFVMMISPLITPSKRYSFPSRISEMAVRNCAFRFSFPSSSWSSLRIFA